MQNSNKNLSNELEKEFWLKGFWPQSSGLQPDTIISHPKYQEDYIQNNFSIL